MIDNQTTDLSTFTLSLGSVTTAGITFSTNSAATRQNIDQALGLSFPGLFTVATTTNSHAFKITATGLSNTNLPTLTFAGTGANSALGDVTTLTEGSGNEVQSLSLSGANNAAFTLALGGVVGAPAGINYAPARNEIQTLTLNATGIAGTPGAAPGDGSAKQHSACVLMGPQAPKS